MCDWWLRLEKIGSSRSEEGLDGSEARWAADICVGSINDGLIKPMQYTYPMPAIYRGCYKELPTERLRFASQVYISGQGVISQFHHRLIQAASDGSPRKCLCHYTSSTYARRYFPKQGTQNDLPCFLCR
jgi:hypothetical protein